VRIWPHQDRPLGSYHFFFCWRSLRRCGHGEGIGEIALLRAVPRTASVVACTDATVYKLAREPFLTAVLGHAATERQADSIAEAWLASDAARGGDGQVAGTMKLG
jgi:CRP-like cAMP-binding protein